MEWVRAPAAHPPSRSGGARGTPRGAGPMSQRPEVPGYTNPAARLHTECAAPAAVMDKSTRTQSTCSESGRTMADATSPSNCWWAAALISCAPHVRRWVVIRRFGRVMRVHEGTRRPYPSRDRPPSMDAARSDRLTMPQTLLLRISWIEPGAAHEPRQPIVHSFRPRARLVGVSIGGRVDSAVIVTSLSHWWRPSLTGGGE